MAGPKAAQKSKAIAPGRSFNVYLPGDKLWLKEKYEKMAKADRRSVSDVIIQTLEDALDQKEGARRK